MSDQVIQSNFKAMVAQKCPHCHVGPVFKYPMYSLKFAQMHDNCPVCNQKYEVEPGFFWGSMYITYGITVIIGLVVGFLYFGFRQSPSIPEVLGLICLALAVLSPFSFRYSRLVMLYAFGFIKFDPSAGQHAAK